MKEQTPNNKWRHKFIILNEGKHSLIINEGDTLFNNKWREQTPNNKWREHTP